jgi:glycolate oxidase FAD binding subunit
VNDQSPPVWPDPPAGGPLGDGRYGVYRRRPESVDELRQVVREAASGNFAIYPQGGATALGYGGSPSRPGVAIDLRSLNQVVDYPHADMTITVQAGITAASLQAVLAAQGQRLLIDIPQPKQATLGGVFATNSCGPRRYGLGRPRDQIIGVSFVTASGELVSGGGRVVKNVAGYDLPKLLTGSLGTLGIITQMTLKVRPRPESSAILWVPLDDVGSAAATLESLNTSDARPVALELLGPSAAAAIGGPLNLPASGWVLAIGLEDNAASVRWQTSRLMIELGRADLTVCENDAADALWSSLTELQAQEHGPVSCAASLPPSAVIEFVAPIDSGRWSIQAHAGSGIIWLHARNDGGWTSESMAAAIGSFHSQAVSKKGSVIVVRCPTDWKDTLKVWGDPRPDWALSARVKQALDPGGLLNPGRFAGIF